MRKLPKELVAFILVTSLLITAGTFVYLYRNSRPKSIAIDLNLIPSYREDAKRMDDEALERKYGAIIRAAITVPKPPSTSKLISEALLFGIFGLPAGFGVWLSYRAVRSARRK
jgi:hypothetical protein